LQPLKGQHGSSVYGQIPYNEIDSYIRESDFMVIPSLSDSFPTVGLEGLMNAVPLLLSIKTGLADYITNGKEGLLFEPDEEGIIKVLSKVETAKPVLRMLSDNARKRYEEEFTIEKYCNKMSVVLFQ